MFELSRLSITRIRFKTKSFQVSESSTYRIFELSGFYCILIYIQSDSPLFGGRPSSASGRLSGFPSSSPPPVPQNQLLTSSFSSGSLATVSSTSMAVSTQSAAVTKITAALASTGNYGHYLSSGPVISCVHTLMKSINVMASDGILFLLCS